MISCYQSTTQYLPLEIEAEVGEISEFVESDRQFFCSSVTNPVISTRDVVFSMVIMIVMFINKLKKLYLNVILTYIFKYYCTANL